MEKVAGSVFDLGPAVRAAKRLVEVSNDFDAAVSEIGPGACKCAIEAANKAMLEATRVLTPVRYSPVPPTEHVRHADRGPVFQL